MAGLLAGLGRRAGAANAQIRPAAREQIFSELGSAAEEQSLASGAAGWPGAGGARPREARPRRHGGARPGRPRRSSPARGRALPARRGTGAAAELARACRGGTRPHEVGPRRCGGHSEVELGGESSTRRPSSAAELLFSDEGRRSSSPSRGGRRREDARTREGGGANLVRRLGSRSGGEASSAPLPLPAS
ncbi:unnamed protein product [Urochloa humidicola]